jgi:hypothetical protein
VEPAVVERIRCQRRRAGHWLSGLDELKFVERRNCNCLDAQIIPVIFIYGKKTMGSLGGLHFAGRRLYLRLHKLGQATGHANFPHLDLKPKRRVVS